MAYHPRSGADTYGAGKTCDRPAWASWARSTSVARSEGDPAAKLARVWGVTARLTGTSGCRASPLTRSARACESALLGGPIWPLASMSGAPWIGTTTETDSFGRPDAG